MVAPGGAGQSEAQLRGQHAGAAFAVFAFKYTCEKNMLQVNMARLLGIMQLHPVIDDELPYQEFAKNKDTTYYSCDFPMFFIFSFFGGFLY